jgi:predicted DNA-binding protein (UPF0251 family)
MPRPRKHRRVWHEPLPVIFKPVGLPLEDLETVTLLYEELEAMRLIDLDGRYQEDAAEQMGISRSTIQRIVTEARRKVTQALIAGAALHIEGGTFRVPSIHWQCNDCAHLWEVKHGSGKGAPAKCPACGSSSIRLRRRRGRRQSEKIAAK